MSKSRKIPKDVIDSDPESGSDIEDADSNQIVLDANIKKNAKNANRAKLKRQERQTCPGLAEDGSKCRYEVSDGSICCKKHSDMENYTAEMFENVQKCKSCSRPRWRYLVDGVHCEKCNQKYCTGRQADGKRCTNKKSPGMNYCKLSHSYMKDYTDEMLNNLKRCSGCPKWKYVEEFNGGSTCKDCRERGKTNRQNKSENNKRNKKKCQHEGCPNYAHEDTIFCGVHALDQTIVDAEASLMKLCASYNRKCTQPMLPPDYPFAKCEGCRERERDKEKRLRDMRKEMNACVNCGKQTDDEKEFIDMQGNKTTKCQECREKQRKSDKIAREEGRKKSYPLSEQAKETKRLWKRANVEKTIRYCLDYRAKQIEKLGDKYWENNARSAQKRRATLSDEERMLNNVEKRKNIHYRLSWYKKRAKYNNIQWGLSDELALELFQSKCDYCDCDPDEFYNGIDRVDNAQGYIESNVLPACRICNMLKACLDYDIFLKRCEHILTHLGLVNGRLHTNIYPTSKSVPIDRYKDRAERKGLVFELTQDEFNKIISGSCYLCGVPSLNNHINGIDRYDSNEGYTKENVRTCCTECNYMKKNYPYNVFIEKIKAIYETNKLRLEYSHMNSNTIDVLHNELYLYQRCASTNSMMRTDFYVPNILIGQWNVINHPADQQFLILQSKALDETDDIILSDHLITLDNGFHNLHSISLSQGHYDTLAIKPFDIDKMMSITYDSIVNVMIPMKHKKIFVRISSIENNVVKIVFSVDNSLKGYCKCSTCVEHKRNRNNAPCVCDSCYDHITHGLLNIAQCFWCSEKYTGEQFRDHRLRIVSDENHISKKYSCAIINNTCESVANAFAKDRRADVARNTKKYEQNRTEEEKNMRREYIRNYMKVRRSTLKANQKSSKTKKTAEQKREEAKIRKQRSRQTMKNKYGDETWRKIHAKEMHRNRLKAMNDPSLEGVINELNDEISKLKGKYF